MSAQEPLTQIAEVQRAFAQLAGRANLQRMALSPQTFVRDGDRKEGSLPMLQALATGDIDSFVTKAQQLGVTKDQAQLAVRDTAALAAIVMQMGGFESW